MGTFYNRKRYPEPPANLPREVAQYLRELHRALNDGELEIERSLNAQEERASLQVLYEEPKNPQDGDEVEVDATVGALSNFGSGAGKYVRRGGAWVYLG